MSDKRDSAFSPAGDELMHQLDGTLALAVIGGLSRAESVAVLRQCLNRHEMALEADLDDSAAREALSGWPDDDDDDSPPLGCS